MKEAFAAVLGGLQSLGHDDARERPVDRLGALGAAARTAPNETREGAQVERANHELRQAWLASLGVDLVRFKFSRVEIAGKDAEDKLSAILAWSSWWTGRKVGLDPAQRDVVAWWAVHEWAEDRCPPRPDGCGGALQVPSSAAPIDGAQPMVTCPQCGGMGKRKWKDEEREKAMGDPFSDAMDHAHRIIAHAESLAMRRGREMLERWP
jgi:hypothetical protein